jgi:hypothetical protein
MNIFDNIHSASLIIEENEALPMVEFKNIVYVTNFWSIEYLFNGILEKIILSSEDAQQDTNELVNRMVSKLVQEVKGKPEMMTYELNFDNVLLDAPYFPYNLKDLEVVEVIRNSSWDRIDKFFKENEHIQPYLEEVGNKLISDQCFSLPIHYVHTIEKLLDVIAELKGER